MAAPVHPYGDYGVALRTLRSGRNLLGYLLFVCVILQLVGFLLMRFTTQPYWRGQPSRLAQWSVPRHPGSSLPAITVSGRSQAQAALPRWRGDFRDRTFRADGLSGAVLRPWYGRKLNLRPQWALTYQLLVPLTQWLGLLAAASQASLIFICLLVVLVAQAPGVAHLTRSLIWSVILLFIILPWQYVLPHFPIPGILYGWHELRHTLGLVFLSPPGAGIGVDQRVIIVARYVLWPVLGLVVMLVTAERFRAGVRLAIGHPLQSLMLGTPRTPGGSTGPAPGGPSGPPPTAGKVTL